ncbi:protein translocase SEC61 complex subunit gamma [Candidatus Marsarchaeota archaeon]|nr:protein translocase SEC61 complex subunit gamma [Candidatus Marsarchaeota archaeon]
MDMNVVRRLRSFWVNSRHIINISYRPKNDEFKKTAKVIIIGILIVGVLGLVLGVIISLAIAGNLSLI